MNIVSKGTAMKARRWRGLALVAVAALLAGCQGMTSTKPPIHINPNMDNQPKYLPQEPSAFFANGSVEQPWVEGTVARGELNEDDVYYRGMDPKTGKPVTENPVPLTMEGLKRGQERFDIYCTPCHSQLGDGKGIVVERGFPPPPNFHDDLVRNYPDGHIFDVITNGIRNMPAYGPQIPVKDRWEIVHYVRALQRSQHATIADVPVEKRDSLR